ncbi:hypothetical protein UFOVP1393_33 [uncultured Caudovirales phage]|uniref:Uncharacterized protein n=1 Tax=uncultured Caudovirales phage TaxID=2100421 RepID=A0A6J5S6T7_9CAUD|nr:hypothetical protein UFOVP1393_33 [uncultured Caudovirales phage]
MKNILDSFKMGTSGLSSRKLTAFVIILCVIAAHVKWLSLGDLSQLGEVFIIDYGFVAALFGMTTYSGLKSKE